MPVPTASSPLARRAYFALLYFSEGAPIGYVWWAMPTRLRAGGMPVDEVAAITALLTLPWALKFLWAPCVDRLRGRRWGYRAWIAAAQLVMGLMLLPLAVLPTEELAGVILWLLLAHAVAAATQDVAIDALAIATVPEAERGRTTGWMQAGMLIGRAAFGGLALAAERWIGAAAVVGLLIACMWSVLVFVWLVPPPRGALGHAPSPPHRGVVVAALRAALLRRSTWVGFGIALTAGAAFEAAGALMGPLLLDHGVTQELVGWFLALPVVAGMIVGSMAGGWIADRVGHVRLVGGSVLAIAAILAAMVAAMALVDARGWSLMALALPLYLCIGSLTAGSYALFMDLTDPAIGGTQFSAYMSATNLCEVWSVALVGAIVASSGYTVGILAAVGLSLLCLPLLVLLPRATISHASPS